MRKAIIAGNWKMNLTPSQGVQLVNELKPLVKDADCDVVVCVPATDIYAVGEALKGSNIKLGAENVHFAESGAYTGEISADMLLELGPHLLRNFRQLFQVHLKLLTHHSVSCLKVLLLLLPFGISYSFLIHFPPANHLSL